MIAQLGVHGRADGGSSTVAAALEHQRVREVVDVLGRAGEVDELGGARPARHACERSLETVFDRLDVVIGLRFDRLDLDAVLEAEVGHQLLQQPRHCPATQETWADRALTARPATRLRPATARA